MHTPGKWISNSKDEVVALDNRSGVVVARCERREKFEFMEHREQRDNALLIAAAPELLATLRDVVARIGKTPIRMDLSEAHALLKRFEERS
jgi:hypothetical protein